MINSKSGTFQPNIADIIAVLWVLGTGTVFGQSKVSTKQQYFFDHGPFVSPRIVQDLETWISDQGEQVVSINMQGAMGTNRYFGDFKVNQDSTDEKPVVTYTDHEACDDRPCPMGPPFFSYKLIGKTASGIYVLLTQDSGGGSGVFKNILLVTLQPDEGLSFDAGKKVLQMNRRRLLIKRLNEITLGDRYSGRIILKGNELHIGKNQSQVKTGLFKKDTIIKIKVRSSMSLK